MLDFDPIAPVYDKLARGFFGSSIQKIQTDLLPLIPADSEVLIVGGGSGWIVPHILEISRVRRLVFLEASQKMLEMAHERLYSENNAKEATCQIEWVFSKHLDLQKSDRFQVIITPFFLDLFSSQDLREVMRILDTHLHNEGIWIYADFALPKAFWRPLAWVILRAMYVFFYLACGLRTQFLPGITRQFESLGYKLLDENERLGSFMITRAYKKTSWT